MRARRIANRRVVSSTETEPRPPGSCRDELRLSVCSRTPKSQDPLYLVIPYRLGWDKLTVMFRPASVLVRVVALAAALCLEASRTPSPAKPNSRETPQAIVATIFRLEQALDEAESHHRVDQVQELIGDDYWGITVGGGIISKRDVLAAAGGREDASPESSDRSVRPLENAAIYTALVLEDHGVDAKTQEPYVLATRVMDWQKRGLQWKLVNDQATGVPVRRVEEHRL